MSLEAMVWMLGAFLVLVYAGLADLEDPIVVLVAIAWPVVMLLFAPYLVGRGIRAWYNFWFGK